MKSALFFICYATAATCCAVELIDPVIGFQVRGIITHRFPRFQGADATEVFHFELVAKGGEWSIEQGQINGQKFYASGVGNSIFAIPVVSQVKSTTNSIAAEIYRGGYPYDLPSSITIPWFVYASASYLKTNEFHVSGLPVFHAAHEPLGVYFWSQPSVSLDPPFVPSKATFIPGNPLWNDVLQHTDEIVRNASYSRFVDDLDRKKFYASIPTNFVACEYKVLSWETFKGLSLPKTFVFEVFMPGDKKATAEPFGSWVGRAESFHPLPVDQEQRMLPKIPDNARLFVFDRRLQDSSVQIEGINYLIKNEWTLELPEFADSVIIAKRKYLKESSTKPTGAIKKGPGVMIAVISVSLLILILVNGKKYTKQIV